ncbi:MAG: hypothetical protein Q4B71_05380 [Cardiobacteriaceae bacterium]|nr:hypothetical protein [Cardiobacteriaceae bacterium]
MKKLALIALAAGLTACSNPTPVNTLDQNELASIRASLEETRAAAIQAAEEARYARQLAEQNAEKINRTFRANQRK